ncbi:general substrate transporter [Lipomyces oligophaga]|uniref:general substrate transporter n=1 Tax=Lipomyces oligophaga TaxID=45792 RepID=UPI0034CF9EDC
MKLPDRIDPESIPRPPPGGIPECEPNYPGGFRGLFKSRIILGWAIFASIGSFLFGYDQAVFSGVLVLHGFQHQFPRIAGSTQLQGWAVSVLQIGALIGAFVNSPIADKISRRYSISIACVIYLIGTTLQGVALNEIMLLIGRILSGFSIGQLSMAVPLWIGEIAPLNIRGSALGLHQLAIAIGIMTAFWINYGVQYVHNDQSTLLEAAWRMPLLIRALPCLVLLTGSVWFMPFSPRWLIKVRRSREALDTIARLRNWYIDGSEANNEYSQIKASAVAEEEMMLKKFPNAKTHFQRSIKLYREMFTQRHLLRRVIVACGLQVFQQLSGINAIVSYAPQLFLSLKLGNTSVSLLVTAMIGIVNVLSTLFAISAVDRFGRRPVLIIGATGMTICHLVIASLYAYYESKWASNPAAGWTTVIFVWLFVVNFAYSAGCISWIYPSEIFPLGVRSQAMGVAVAANWASNFLIGLFTPVLLAKIRYGTFFLFAGCTLALLIWVSVSLPETKGVSIEDMDKLWGAPSNESFDEEVKQECHVSEAEDKEEVETAASSIVVGPKK